MAIIAFQDVSYTYPATDQVALQVGHLEIQPGEFVGIIGSNGAGKTTFCHLIAGFIPHFFHGRLEGRVQVAGKDTRATPLSELVLKAGLVFQNPFNQISGAKFTVYEEIAFGLENLGVHPQEIRTRVDQVMSLTGIADLAERSPYELSGGQQQRVALASILVMKPEVLVLDEPTSQLDPVGSQQVFQVIKELSRAGITVVMTEHKLEWLAEFADRVVALSQGEILLAGPPAEVLTSPLLPERHVGVSRYTAVARRAVQAGLWQADRPLPVTLAEAIAGFSRGNDGH